MATILNIETATRVCSVALAIDGKVISIRESHTRNSHAERITIFCEQLVQEAGLTFHDLDAVAVSMGPGSYTGLRIGVSTAKGYCFALDKPLISIPTLHAMAAGMKKKSTHPDQLFCPMIDARRMEVYAAIFNGELKEVQPTAAVIVDENSFTDYLQKQEICFAGDGAEKCMEVLNHQEHASFFENFHASSAHMASLSEAKFNMQQLEDVAYFEPFYLKDFVAGTPRVKGLR